MNCPDCGARLEIIRDVTVGSLQPRYLTRGAASIHDPYEVRTRVVPAAAMCPACEYSVELSADFETIAKVSQ